MPAEEWKMSKLSLLGGTPIRTGGWPRWPPVVPGVLNRLEEVLASGRWAISGLYVGYSTFEQRFAAAFAKFCGVRHCIPTASGTASLMIVLEALDIGAGDEVIIPGLTWCASASTVLGVNAVPVLVDADPYTLCLAPEAVEAAVTPKTRAICAVHLYSALADLDRLGAIAEKHGLPLIEDCAQAHGAAYRGNRVGSIGVMAAFSMQHSKLLTSGEGGAVVTSDDRLARRAAQLRADGRLFRDEPPPEGELELVEVGDPMGSNRCLSELQAAVLFEMLPELLRWNETRAVNAQRLGELLKSTGAFQPQNTSEGTTARTYYEYAFSVDEEVFDGIPVAVVGDALRAELGIPFQRTYSPLNDNVLYRPWTRRRFHISEEHLQRVDPGRFSLPECERAHRRYLTFHHRFLLGTPDDVRDLEDSFQKVLEHRDELQRVACSEEIQ